MGDHAEMNHLDTSATADSDSMESDVKVRFMFFALPSVVAFFFCSPKIAREREKTMLFKLRL